MIEIYRTTKCFSGWTDKSNGGSFPRGFMNWVRANWWGENRCYLCAGINNDEAVKVDIRSETNPTLCEDATKTSLEDNSFDWIMIDPPYSKDLARKYYNTEDYYHSINAFTKEAGRICKKDGLILTLSYEIPKRIKGCDFIAICGIYTVPMTSYMRCFTVSRKVV